MYRFFSAIGFCEVWAPFLEKPAVLFTRHKLRNSFGFVYLLNPLFERYLFLTGLSVAVVAVFYLWFIAFYKDKNLGSRIDSETRGAKSGCEKVPR